MKVWQLSHKLTLKVYSITSKFPVAERYGLTLQLRRAASSVPTNIAEGRCRKSEKEFSHFVNIALGSCGEVIYLLLLTRDLSILDKEVYEDLREGYEGISRMLNGLVSSLK